MEKYLHDFNEIAKAYVNAIETRICGKVPVMLSFRAGKDCARF